VNIARFNLSRETAATIERRGNRAELIAKPSMKITKSSIEGGDSHLASTGLNVQLEFSL
jgi:hypothetical protein